MELSMKLAGVPFRARVLYPETKKQCAGYLTEEPPAFTVEIDEAAIRRERRLIRDCEMGAGQEPYPYTDAELESGALYRETAERLSRYGTVLVHGSAVGLDGESYLFAAPSGTGKSTHTRLWREVFGSRAVMVNDDKPLLRCTAGGVFVCGSPWNGKHNIGGNVTLPLRAVCFLHRGEKNRIEPLRGGEAFLALLRSTYRSQDAETDRRILETVEALCRQLAFYRLYCNMEPEAAVVAHRGMSRRPFSEQRKGALP